MISDIRGFSDALIESNVLPCIKILIVNWQIANLAELSVYLNRLSIWIMKVVNRYKFSE